MFMSLQKMQYLKEQINLIHFEIQISLKFHSVTLTSLPKLNLHVFAHCYKYNISTHVHSILNRRYTVEGDLSELQLTLKNRTPVIINFNDTIHGAFESSTCSLKCYQSVLTL